MKKIRFKADYKVGAQPGHEELWASCTNVLDPDSVEMVMTSAVQMEKKDILTWVTQMMIQLKSGRTLIYISENDDFSEVLTALEQS